MEILRDAFNNTAKVSVVVMHVDLTGATELKTSSAEVSWLPTFGWFFDQVTESVSRNGGTVCKYLSSGVIATFPVVQAAQAINAAIAIQERLREAKRDNTYLCNCSVGITTGKVVPFVNGQQQDFIGTSVDQVERLALGGSPGAVFVDEETVSAANMMEVFSIYGNAVSREGRGYLGAPQKLPSAGSSIDYREVLWDAQPFGVKSSMVTDMTAPQGQPPTPPPPAVHPARGNEQDPWVVGRVTRWDAVRGSGFASGRNGGAYYLHRDNLVRGVVDLAPGDDVFFLAEPQPVAGRNPRANVVVPLGALLDVELLRVREKYGFLDARDGKGFRRDLFVDLGSDAPLNYRVGQVLRVRVGSNNKGPVGRIHTDEQRAAS